MTEPVTAREEKLKALVRDFAAWAEHKCRFTGNCHCGLVQLLDRMRAIFDPPKIPAEWVLFETCYLDERSSLRVYGHSDAWFVRLWVDGTPTSSWTYSQDDRLAIEALVESARDLLKSSGLSADARRRLERLIDPHHRGS